MAIENERMSCDWMVFKVIRSEPLLPRWFSVSYGRRRQVSFVRCNQYGQKARRFQISQITRRCASRRCVARSSACASATKDMIDLFPANTLRAMFSRIDFRQDSWKMHAEEDRAGGSGSVPGTACSSNDDVERYCTQSRSPGRLDKLASLSRIPKIANAEFVNECYVFHHQRESKTHNYSNSWQ